jgi:transcriptional regulator of arginine metabolism
MDKRARQAAIRELIETHAVGSQEELRRLLRQRGWDVTQSTLSRDLREMRLARIPSPDGSARYAVPEGSEVGQPRLEALLPHLFTHVDGVGELVVLHTHRGGAQPVAEALDNEEWPEVLGTLAGDDTILIICRSVAAREKVTRRVKGLAKAGE